MRVELKKIQIVQRLSEETLCFTANVVIDGKVVGQASNRGHGGPTDVHIADRELATRLEAYAKEQPAAKDHHPGMALEILIDDMVYAHQRAQDEKKLIKKRESYREKLKASLAQRKVVDADAWVLIEVDFVTGERSWSPYSTIDKARDHIAMLSKPLLERWSIFSVATGNEIESGR